MHGLPIVSRWPIAIECPVIRKVLRSKLTVYAPCRYSEVLTNCPFPVRVSATRAAQTAAASVMPADLALAAVVHLQRRADPTFEAEHAAEHPRRIARRRLDLDDIRTPVGEYPACRRTRDPYAEFDNIDTLQWSGHGHPSEALYKSPL